LGLLLTIFFLVVPPGEYRKIRLIHRAG
jgi:hypothetical protein